MFDKFLLNKNSSGKNNVYQVSNSNSINSASPTHAKTEKIYKKQAKMIVDKAIKNALIHQHEQNLILKKYQEGKLREELLREKELDKQRRLEKEAAKKLEKENLKNFSPKKMKRDPMLISEDHDQSCSYYELKDKDEEIRMDEVRLMEDAGLIVEEVIESSIEKFKNSEE